MGWRDNLRKASFRGAAFGVESAEAAGGRRLAVHEFPLRDEPATEDLGRKARTFSVEGFVLGADYMAARDALQEALEARGPGVLVHPWRGEISVVCTGYRVRESARDGGMAVFSMEFAEPGRWLYPAGSEDTGHLVGSRADAARSAAADSLDRTLDVAKRPSWVQEDAASLVRDLVEAVASARAEVGETSAWARVLSGLRALSPANLAGSGLGTRLLALFRDCGDLVPDSSRAGRRMEEMLGLAAWTPPPSAARTTATVSGRVAVANADALAAFARQCATAEAVRSAGQVEPATRPEGRALLARVQDAADAVLEADPDDAAYTAFSALRAASVRDLSGRILAAPAVRTVKTARSLPSLAVSGRQYGVSAYSEEIVSRNGVRHPGFVPPGELEVVDHG